MQKLKTQKGITLIALIITIIVMLILVGVTVTVALNGGLFNTAKQATNKTEIELEKERLLELALGALDNKGQVDFENKLDPAILADGTFEGTNGRYTSKKTGNKYTVSSRGSITLDETIAGEWEQNGDEIKFVAEDGTILKTLTVGQTIAYDEGTSGSYTTDANKGTGISYTSSTKTLNQGTYKVVPTDKEKEDGIVEAGNLEWMVLGLNDAGQVEIISSAPTKCGLALYGKAGYLNAVTDENGNLGTLDTFCNELYGKGTGAVSARSITPEDLYKLLNEEYQPTIQENTYRYYDDGEIYWLSTAKVTEENKNDISKWVQAQIIAPLYGLDFVIDSSNPGPVDVVEDFAVFPSSANVESNALSTGQISILDTLYDMSGWEETGYYNFEYMCDTLSWYADPFCYNWNTAHTFVSGTGMNSSYIGNNPVLIDGNGERVNFDNVRPIVTLKTEHIIKMK